MVEESENNIRKRCMVNVRTAPFNGNSPTRVRPEVAIKLTGATVDIDTLSTLSETSLDWFPYTNTDPNLLVFTAPFSGFYSVTYAADISNNGDNNPAGRLKIYATGGAPTTLAGLSTLVAERGFNNDNVSGLFVNIPVTVSCVVNLQAGQTLVFLTQFFADGQVVTGDVKIEELSIYTDRVNT